MKTTGDLEQAFDVMDRIIAIDLEKAKEEYPRQNKVILRNWYYMESWNKLLGDVENHPRLGDQSNVTTSLVQYIAKDETWAVTKNTFYILKDKLL